MGAVGEVGVTGMKERGSRNVKENRQRTFILTGTWHWSFGVVYGQFSDCRIVFD